MGLYVLFLTEMWERFCFYGMRALLVLYVVKRIAHPRASPGPCRGFDGAGARSSTSSARRTTHQLADQIYGLYTAFVYLTPLFGGILADRLVRPAQSVLFGGIVMAIGEFMLVSEALFFPALW